jgi:hypothetical protein
MKSANYEFIQFPAFSKQLDLVNEPDLLTVIEDELKNNPEAGALLKGGIRKVRIPARGRSGGKRGGFRVWHYFYTQGDRIFLLYLLDKREAQNISKSQEAFLVAALKTALNHLT